MVTGSASSSRGWQCCEDCLSEQEQDKIRIGSKCTNTEHSWVRNFEGLHGSDSCVHSHSDDYLLSMSMHVSPYGNAPSSKLYGTSHIGSDWVQKYVAFASQRRFDDRKFPRMIASCFGIRLQKFSRIRINLND